MMRTRLQLPTFCYLLLTLFCFTACTKKDENQDTRTTNGMVYVGDITHGFYKLDAATGKLKLRFPLNYDVGSFGPAAYANGVLYVGNSAGGMYAFDPGSGKVKWNQRIAMGGIQHLPAIGGATVYACSVNDTLYAFDAASGQIRWKYSEGANYAMEGTPVVANGLVYVSGGGKKLLALDAANGRLRWETSTGAMGLDLTPAFHNNTIFVGTDTLFAINALNGQTKWKKKANTFFSPAPTAYGNLLFIGDGINVQALNITDGSLKWQFRTDDGPFQVLRGAPAVANGVLFAGGNKLYAIDASTGQKKWTAPENFGGIGNITVADGNVYVPAVALYAIDAATGAIKWQFIKDNAIYTAPLVIDAAGTPHSWGNR